MNRITVQFCLQLSRDHLWKIAHLLLHLHMYSNLLNRPPQKSSKCTVKSIVYVFLWVNFLLALVSQCTLTFIAGFLHHCFGSKMIAVSKLCQNWDTSCSPASENLWHFRDHLTTLSPIISPDFRIVVKFSGDASLTSNCQLASQANWGNSYLGGEDTSLSHFQSSHVLINVILSAVHLFKLPSNIFHYASREDKYLCSSPSKGHIPYVRKIVLDLGIAFDLWVAWVLNSGMHIS